MYLYNDCGNRLMFVKHVESLDGKITYPRKDIFCKIGGGERLEITYDYAKIKKKVSWGVLRQRKFDHWRYKEFYPRVNQMVSMGEGGTPLVGSKGNPKLLFKLESLNPTGSFKDRGSTIEISHALECGAKKVVCASTGNMGASVAAYCARAGLSCEIILPSYAAGEKFKQIQQAGAKITKVKGDYTSAVRTAEKKCAKGKAFLVGDYAFRGEGEKSIGYEIADEGVPDFIVAPIGNGTMLSSVWKAFVEMKRVGLIIKLPKLIGVQAKGCDPVVKAFKTRKEIRAVTPKTVATAIACGDPLDGTRVLRGLWDSGGDALAVSDKEILAARKHMAIVEGIDAEPSGAVAFAGYRKLRIPHFKRVVVLVTGHGLKDLTHR